MVIYCILNKINLKRYIGSAVKFSRRKAYHLSKLRLNVHDNSYLQNSWNKYGEYNFEFLILERVIDISKIIEREQWWIDNTPSQYNICKVAGNCMGRKHTEEAKRKIGLYNSTKRVFTQETRSKISLSKKGIKRDSSKWNRKVFPRKVYEYSIDNQFVKEWFSIKEIASFYKLAESYVWTCANKNKQVEKLKIILSFIKY